MQNCNIDIEDYKSCYCLWGFDFTPDQGADQGHLHPMKSGNLKIELQFTKSLPATVNVIVYAEFDNLIEIKRLLLTIKKMTTTDELRDILNRPLMKSLHGQVCPKDELPVGKKPLQAKAFIVNTDLAIDPGQHWLALYFKENKAIYFDSYGLPPLKDHILPFIQNNSLGWIENTQMLQDVTSEVCGLNCIYVLYELNRGSSLQNILSNFSKDNLIKNDNDVLLWFSRKKILLK